MPFGFDDDFPWMFSYYFLLLLCCILLHVTESRFVASLISKVLEFCYIYYIQVEMAIRNIYSQRV